MNAVDLLERQHRELESLFRDLERAGEDDSMKLRRLCARLADVFAAHAEIEEQFFYPAVKVGDLAWKVDQAATEHFEATKLAAELLDAEVGSPDFFFVLAEFKDAVISHLEEEEGDLFPSARKVLSREELNAFGEQMMVRFEELMAEEPRREIPHKAEEPVRI